MPNRASCTVTVILLFLFPRHPQALSHKPGFNFDMPASFDLCQGCKLGLTQDLLSAPRALALSQQ